ncbi:MAG: leucine-rich repeat domain-containing protein [Thermoguttaceae bacterium]
MSSSFFVRGASVGLMAGLLCLTGCPAPKQPAPPAVDGGAGQPTAPPHADTPPAAEPIAAATAKAEDVQAAKALLDKLGAGASYKLAGDVLSEIIIEDGSTLSPDNIALFGELGDLQTLQIYNYRELNDQMAAELSGLKKLTNLALTNSVIGDPTVELIAESLPDMKVLDLSSNTNMTNGVLKVICQLTKLERLLLVQNRFNDVGTGYLESLKQLQVLDLRGNMEAGDMTMEIVAGLPKLAAFKHRSTTVTDMGMEYLANNKTLKSLLVQDFAITGQAGQQIAKLPSLQELEIFRCQGFGSDGVLALKGVKLTRLTLRDLPMIDDQAMEVFTDLPALKRLYLHELSSLSDSGLANLKSLQSLEVLDIWTIPQMTDATVEVIAGLPNLKELSIRTTGVTDAAVDKILAMPKLQTLVFKDNASLTAEGMKKLSGKKWSKLDTGK